jgi:hypothetical protein
MSIDKIILLCYDGVSSSKQPNTARHTHDSGGTHPTNHACHDPLTTAGAGTRASGSPDRFHAYPVSSLVR